MTDETPVVVNPSPLGQQFRSGLRYALVFLSYFAPDVLAKFHITPAAQAFIQTEEFRAGLCGLVSLAVGAWAQIEARVQKALLVKAAHAAPDSKFTVSK